VPANSWLDRLTQQESINFLLTNRIPRRWATLFMGWFSRIETPLVRNLSIAVWRWFADDLKLEEARKSEFSSLHDCFIRQLKPGTRPINRNPSVVVSPCDAIVGACGRIRETELYQAKGFPYTLMDLLGDPRLVDRYRNGLFMTLRLKSSMYHRFHAPYDCSVNQVNYISGDTWNVNPIALKRIERLFCKNERAVIELQLAEGEHSITLVPVAAILVASIRLHFLADSLNLRYQGPNRITCKASFTKGDEMGYFQHGSTIIVFVTDGFRLCDTIVEGTTVRVGEALMSRSMPPHDRAADGRREDV
jgi:phosphatidylserine decarboxylase